MRVGSNNSSFNYDANISPNQTSSSNAYLADTLSHIDHSKQLSSLEKKLYKQMLRCVDECGTNRPMDLFEAAGHCLDTDLGSETRNMSTIQAYADLMGDTVGNTVGKNEVLDPAVLTAGRPGFFLITPPPNQQLYFLKADEKGSFSHYDLQSDSFIPSEALPITGKELLVLPNRTDFPTPAAYVSTPTIDQKLEEGHFYHEEQELGKCAIHAIHAFIGAPVVNPNQLSLLKLEQIVESDAEHYKDKLKTPTQMELFKKEIRFNTAQSGCIQAELGNDEGSVTMLLKILAENGAIDSRFQEVQTFKTTITSEAIRAAHLSGAMQPGEALTEEHLTKLKTEIEKELSSNQEKIDALKQALGAMEAAGTHYNSNGYLTKEYMKLFYLLEPYQKLESILAQVNDSISTFDQLKELNQT